MAKNIQVTGTVRRTIEKVHERYANDPDYNNARLRGFEKLTGVSPTKAVETIVMGAAARCRVKDCGLTVQVDDQVEELGGFGIPPNESEASKEREVTAAVTCSKSCSRRACQSVISRTTKTIEGLFDEAAGGVIKPAQRARMEPAERRAEEIRANADVEAEKVLASARGGLENVGTEALADFRERYDLAPPAPGKS